MLVLETFTTSIQKFIAPRQGLLFKSFLYWNSLMEFSPFHGKSGAYHWCDIFLGMKAEGSESILGYAFFLFVALSIVMHFLVCLLSLVIDGSSFYLVLYSRFIEIIWFAKTKKLFGLKGFNKQWLHCRKWQF